MILPTKHLRNESSLIYIGGIIQNILSSDPMSVDQLWHSAKASYTGCTHGHDLTYDWFVLALSMLYEIGNISFVNGRIVGVHYD